MLTKGLVEVYRDNPALFLNMSELYLDPAAMKQRQLRALKTTVDRLLVDQMPPYSLSCDVKGEKKSNFDCVGTRELNARVLLDLFSPCYLGAKSDNNPNGETACSLPPMILGPTSSSSLVPNLELREIRNVKDIMAGLSLNTVRVVVSGIMTVDVELVPAVLTKVAFDSPSSGQKPIWEDTTSKHTGVIYGKYLTNGKPVISGIKVPSDTTATVEDYIDTTSLAAVPDKSTDSELHFAAQFKKTIPTGSTLTFQVSKSSSRSGNGAGANTQETTTSMSLDYSVSYTPSASTDSTKTKIAITVFDSPSDLLKAGQVKGHLTGTNLTGQTIGIKSITLVNGTAADLKTYIATGSPANTSPSDDTTLNFILSLKAGLPPNSKIVLSVTGKSADGATQTIEGNSYSVPSK